MLVLACYDENWKLPNLKFDESIDHVRHLKTSLIGIIDRVNEISPQVVFIIGFEQTHELSKQLQLLCTNDTQLEVIPFCENPEPSFLLTAMQVGVREVLTNCSEENIKNTLDRIRQRFDVETNKRNSGAKRIAFISAKGGDGGTFVAANFAATLAKHENIKVLGIDLSLPFGDMEMYLTPSKISHDLSDFCTEVERLDLSLFDLMVHKIEPNFHLIVTPRSFDRVVNINAVQVERLVELAAKNYDFIIFDIGAGVDPISIRLLEKLDKLFIVTNLTMPSLRRSAQMLSLWETLGYPPSKVSLVANRFDSASELSLDDAEEATGKKILYTVDNNHEGVQGALLKGLPFIDLNPGEKITNQISKWVSEFSGKPIKTEKPSLWNRLKSR